MGIPTPGPEPPIWRRASSGRGDGRVVVAIGDHALRLAAAFDAGLGADLPIDPQFAPSFWTSWPRRHPTSGRAAACPERRLSDPAGKPRLRPALVPLASARHVRPLPPMITPISTHPSITLRTSVRCFVPTTRCCRTTSGCRSAIKGGRRRWWSTELGTPTVGQSRARIRHARLRADSLAGTTNSSSASSWGATTTSARRHGNGRGGEDLRRIAPQRLVGPRPPAWEYQPLGPFSRRTSPNSFALDRHGRRAEAIRVPMPAGRPVTPSRCPTCACRTISPGRSSSTSCCPRARCAPAVTMRTG